jgi:hypothetical protein
MLYLCFNYALLVLYVCFTYVLLMLYLRISEGGGGAVANAVRAELTYADVC